MEPQQPEPELPPWMPIARGEIGIKERPGPHSDHPRILEYLRTVIRVDPLHDEIPWCFGGETEILSHRGFVRLDELRDDDDVVQVDPFLTVLPPIRPIRVIRKRHKGSVVHLSNRDIRLVCDPQHRFLGQWNSAKPNAPVELRPISDLGSMLRIPRVSWSIESDNAAWSDRDLALLAAFLSDGCLKSGSIHIQVSKQRKLDALLALEPAHVYRAAVAYGQSTVPLTDYRFRVPACFSGIFADYKSPKWQLLFSWSRRQIEHFVRTYAVFDGGSRGLSTMLYSSLPNLRDWLQAAIALAGFHSSYRAGTVSKYSGRPCFTVSYCTEKRTRTILGEDLERDEADVDLYCVEVPTGAIVIRTHGTVIPVGNCSAYANWCMHQAGVDGTGSAAARSWLRWGVPLAAPRPGCIVVLWRGTPNDRAHGHVAFLERAEGRTLYLLGGNQRNQVCVEPRPITQLLGYRWPKPRVVVR